MILRYLVPHMDQLKLCDAGNLPDSPCRGPDVRDYHVDLAQRFADEASGRARVGLINRAADLAISPISDEMQWALESLERSV